MRLGSQLRALGAFVRPYRPWLVVTFVATMCGALLDLAFPWVMGHLVDSAFVDDGTGRLDRAALLLLVVFAGQAICTGVRIASLARAGQGAVNDLRSAAFTHLLGLPMPFHDERSSGELASRLTADTALVHGASAGAGPRALSSLVTVIGASVLLVVISPQLALIVAALVPIAAVIARGYGRRLRAVSRDYQRGLAAANALATEAFGAIRVVKWFRAAEGIAGRYRRRLDGVVALGLRRAAIRSTWSPAATFFTSFGVVVVVWVGGRQVQSGGLSPGELVSFLLYARIVAGGISTLVEQYGRLANAMGASERIFTLLDRPTEGTSSDGARPDLRPERRGEVGFEHVSFRYPTRDGEVLHDVDLHVAPEETVALVGVSGSGKSTLTQLIGRFYDPDVGRVLIDGVDVRDQDLDDLRRSIAVVPQDIQLISGTIAANLRLGRPDATTDEIRAAAKAANAHRFIRRFEDGYRTEIGERGRALSGGQRQRIAIARAILADPRILILDEATNALDVENERLVREALQRLIVGRTNIVIAHRGSTVSDADRVIVLERGRIVEEGRPDELLAGNGWYARMAALDVVSA